MDKLECITNRFIKSCAGLPATAGAVNIKTSVLIYPSKPKFDRICLPDVVKYKDYLDAIKKGVDIDFLQHAKTDIK